MAVEREHHSSVEMLLVISPQVCQNPLRQHFSRQGKMAAQTGMVAGDLLHWNGCCDHVLICATAARLIARLCANGFFKKK